MIDSLSVRNPYFQAIKKQAIQRPSYNIIGDGGRGGTPDNSYGVRDYHASRWDRARSEQIVRFGQSYTSQFLVFGALHQLVRQKSAELQTKEMTKKTSKI